MKLEKQKILLGRRAVDVAPLETALRAVGADVHCIPLIEVHSIQSVEMQSLSNNIDIVVITSRNAIPPYLTLRSTLNTHFLAVVGEKSAAPLLRNNISPEIVGSGAGAMALLEHLNKRVALEGKHILYPCSSLAQKEFTLKAEKLGATVHMLPVYENRKPSALTKEQLRGFNVAVFYSSSGAINFYSLATPADTDRLTAIAIGKTTAATLAQLGAAHIITATSPDTDALLKAIYKHQLQDKMEQKNDVSHCPA